MTDKEIEELQNQLTSLTLEFNRRASEINTRLDDIVRRRQSLRAKAQSDETEEFVDAQEQDDTIRIGDKVQIINDYRYNEKGAIGKVTFINAPKDRVTFFDSKGKKYIRAPWNLRKLKWNEIS